MKKIIIAALISLLFSISCLATNRFISANNGDNSNTGLDFENAWLTLAYSNGKLSAGDTVVIAGQFNEMFYPTNDGTAGNNIVMIDSFRYFNGFDINTPPLVWSATINGGSNIHAIYMQGNVDYWEFIGLHLIGSTWSTFSAQGSDDHHWLIQCKFTNHGDCTGSFLFAAGNYCYAISCTFDSDINCAQMEYCIYQDYGLFWMYNCTIDGKYYTRTIMIGSSATGFTMANCIIKDTFTSATAKLFEVEFYGDIDSLDYNCYYSPNKTVKFNVGGDNYNTFAAYQSDMLAIDSNFEKHSFYSDPELSSVNTIKTDSPCFNTAKNNEYTIYDFPSIGFFQQLLYTVRKTPMILITY